MVKFGMSDAMIINDLDTKNKIIDYIYNLIDLSKYRYNMLENMQQLSYLKNNEHFVAPNFKGFNYFLLFNKVSKITPEGKKEFSQCIAIDKKNLSYNKKTVDIKKVFMYKIKVMASPMIFKGTLFDAKIIKNVMLIKDSYYIMGNSLIDMEMDEKMVYLDTILTQQFQKDGCTNFKLKINKLYSYNMLDHLVNKIIPSCELDTTGLIFYPKKSGISYIFTDKKPTEKIVINNSSPINNNSYDMIHQIKDFLESRIYSYELNETHQILDVEPTNITDVYNIYDNDNKLGIAHIPNLKISKFCKENIINKIKCVCTFYKPFNKWIPLKLYDTKLKI
jgi:hypothetical protein